MQKTWILLTSLFLLGCNSSPKRSDAPITCRPECEEEIKSAAIKKATHEGKNNCIVIGVWKALENANTEQGPVKLLCGQQQVIYNYLVSEPNKCSKLEIQDMSPTGRGTVGP